jgi:hypothetical protein
VRVQLVAEVRRQQDHEEIGQLAGDADGRSEWRQCEGGDRSGHRHSW